VNNSKPANFIGPRLPYVRRKQNPVKPARRAKRVQPHISAGEIEKRRAIR
jgi:hypothetical protein